MPKSINTQSAIPKVDLSANNKGQILEIIEKKSEDLIWVLPADLNKTPVWVTSSVFKMRGFTVEEAMQQTVHEMLTPESFRHAEEVFAEELKNEEIGADPNRTRKLTLEMIRKDGSTFLTEASISLLHDENGHFEGLMGISRDITETLHQQQQIRQMQKMEAIGTLSGGIAHDLNNILTTITGYVELVLSTHQDDEELREDLTEVKKAANRAASLTKQLLTFSRQDSITKVVYDINSSVASMKKLLLRVKNENLHIEDKSQSNLHCINADPKQIEQVLLNLLINAKDAMPQGGTICIKTNNITRDNNDFVHLSITDQGEGISEENLERIFDPFFTTKDIGKGTGLGLSVVYGIIQQHNGSIEVESKVGEGTTFHIYLPATKEKAQQQSEQTLEDYENFGEGKNVLIIDDEIAVRTIIGRILSKVKFKVTQSRNADEARKLINDAKNNFDLIICDIGLPGTRGDTFRRELIEQGIEIPIVLISGYGGSQINIDILKKEGAFFIPKPFTHNDIYSLVKSVLKR